MDKEGLAKYNAVKRAEKRAQKAKEKESVSEAKGLLRLVWRFFTGGL